jgi:alkylhydroperoxidase family enzyme
VEAIKRRRWRELPGLSERQRALCAVAEKMTLAPREMTAADWQPLRDVGLDDEGLLELGHLISIFNYFPRMADGFGLNLDPQLLQAAATGVPLKRRE